MAVPRQLTGRIAPQAYPLSLGLLVLGVVLAALGLGAWALAALALSAANLAFFRNPRRSVPVGEHRILSPADGRVVEVARVPDPDGFVEEATRIAIFLSIFDVHINRVPVSGKVRALRRSGSEFLAAFRSDASALNVKTRLDLETPRGDRVGVAQITGLIARRIVCYAGQGDSLSRGEPYGLMCYGSRMELYLPPSARIFVKAGDRVHGASTVIAELGS